jgi:hypothetical protein
LFKKTIEYTDFNDNKTSKDFYFHMSKAELLAMAADNGDMMNRIQRIIDAKDGRAILKEFRDLIEMSVGVRSADGERFIKDTEAKSQLLDSPAYDELLMELATNANASAEFVRQLIPEEMQEQMRKQFATQKQDETPNPFAEKKDNRPTWMKEHRNPTHSELKMMDLEEMRLAFQNRITE